MSDTDEPVRITPVLLSGGTGTRLWPLSTAARPKQFQALVGEGTLLEQTADRVRDGGDAGLAFAAPLVVCNAAHVGLVREQLATGWGGIVAEPVGRNTAASALLAAEVVARDEPEGLILLLPSDHHVPDAAAFRRAVATAAPAARAGALAVFGVRPDRPETGYGYILPEAGEAAVRRVERFTEKPDGATAAAWLVEGRRLWNAGVVLARADRLIAEATRFRPDIVDGVRKALDGASVTDGVTTLDAEAFAACPAESLDRAVLERTDRAVVVALDAGWSDVGSFEALWRASARDGDGVAGPAGTVRVGARDCGVVSDGPVVALVGVKGLSVVVRDGVVLVVAHDADQRVREAVEALRAEGLL